MGKSKGKGKTPPPSSGGGGSKSKDSKAKSHSLAKSGGDSHMTPTDKRNSQINKGKSVAGVSGRGSIYSKGDYSIEDVLTLNKNV